MFILRLIIGIVIVAIAGYKYTAINRGEPRSYNLLGLKISEEIIWIGLFITGVIIMIMVAIHFLEPHFAGRGTY